ncbi:LacI family transcriptional regulator [Terrimicrobium sacchariphilum]|uniref:LacI family transcriptional regulator n=2 Tax=Terrimicrobium sacchariphilum TaxID=690879 RepID=A0A146G549_TERSA|nr:LacI family transcriptional regulator [Terrimicrobium sacchariphilum]
MFGSNRSMKQRTSPSMAEIAAAAGVAKSTVSLALRNDPRVAPEAREHIQRVAEGMGYQTNALVARLMAELRRSRKQNHVAMLALINVSKVKRIDLKVPVVSDRLKGARERAELLGYSVDHFWLHEPDVTPERLGRILVARGALGVIIYGSRDETDIERCRPVWSILPSVVIGNHPKSTGLNFVANDHYATSLEACRRLSAAGYTRIGFVLDKWLDTLLEQRFTSGYLAGIDYSRSGPPPLYLEDPAEAPRPQGKKRFFDWVKKHRPDACICLNDFILDWIGEIDVKVPEEMGMALLDLPDALRGRVAGMYQGPEREGMKAVDSLVGQIHRRESGLPPFQTGLLLESEWIPGPTVRDIAPGPTPTRRKSRAKND